jgi:hypothetical protein
MGYNAGACMGISKETDVHDVNASDLGPDEFVVAATKNDEKLLDWGFTGPVADTSDKLAG